MGMRTNGMAVLGILFLIASTSGSAAQVQLSLSLTGMDPYVGGTLEARVVDTATGGEVLRLTGEQVRSPTVNLVLALPETEKTYRLDAYVDQNQNGRYDPPPVDAAWQMDLGMFSGDATTSLEVPATMVDIDWPPAADGTIGLGEYGHFLVDDQTGMSLYWQNDLTTLYVGLVSPGTGWAAVGFGAASTMAGANILIGAVKDGVLTLRNDFGSGPITHTPDKAPAILQRGGTEVDGKTILEFAIPLAGSDPQHATLAPGQDVTVILAFHATSDDLAVKHTARSTVRIALD